MPDAIKELEWKTRKERIDTKMVSLGWDIINYKSEVWLLADIQQKRHRGRLFGRL